MNAESLTDLLAQENAFVIAVDDVDVAYASSNSVMPRKVSLLDPQSHEFYQVQFPDRDFVLRGTAPFFWDADKYLGAERYAATTFSELKNAFEEAGFSFNR